MRKVAEYPIVMPPNSFNLSKAYLQQSHMWESPTTCEGGSFCVLVDSN